MSNYLDYYKAYRLVKVSDPYLPYVKGETNGWRIHKMPGICKLYLLMESETIDEIMEQYPIFKTYYEIGYRNVKPFVFSNELEFQGLHLRSGEKCVCYHANGTAHIQGELAFRYIYESFDNEVIMIASSWNAEKFTEMSLTFNRGKKYWIHYDLELNEK